MKVCILAVDFLMIFVDALLDVLYAVFNLSDFFTALALLNVKLLCQCLLSDYVLLKFYRFCSLLVYLFLEGLDLVSVLVECVVDLLNFLFCRNTFLVCLVKGLLVMGLVQGEILEP